MIDRLESIFKWSIEDYNAIKQICIQKQVALFLLNNRIEHFNNLSRTDFDQCKQFLKTEADRDCIFALKLLYSLNNGKRGAGIGPSGKGRE